MSTTESSRLHVSARSGRLLRCVAHKECPFGRQKSLLDLAKEGGAEIHTHGHSYAVKVSEVEGGAFTVGTDKKTQTFRDDGSRMTKAEARAWRRQVAKARRIEEEKAEAEARREEFLNPPPVARNPSAVKRRGDYLANEKQLGFLSDAAGHDVEKGTALTFDSLTEEQSALLGAEERDGKHVVEFDGTKKHARRLLGVFEALATSR